MERFWNQIGGLWSQIGDIDSGVIAAEQRLNAVEETVRKDITAELERMSKDARRLDSFLEQQECGPNECCFSLEGRHMPHCGRCVTKRYHKLNVMRWYASELTRAMREQTVQVNGVYNERACERWRECVIKLQRRSRVSTVEAYVAARERCERSLIDILNTGLHRDMRVGENCCLCELELQYELPSAQRVRMRPYIAQSIYSSTFHEHLRCAHWRDGYACSACTRVFPTEACGRTHIQYAKKPRHTNSVLLPLKGSWSCMRSRMKARMDQVYALGIPRPLLLHPLSQWICSWLVWQQL